MYVAGKVHCDFPVAVGKPFRVAGHAIRPRLHVQRVGELGCVAHRDAQITQNGDPEPSLSLPHGVGFLDVVT